MSTRDDFIQFKGQTRSQKFPAQYAQGFHLNKPNQAPQAPNMTMKTNARNQYRGHGRGQ
jgi:hypothetical protein